MTTARCGGRLSALRTGRLLPPGIFLVLIFTTGWVDPRAMVWSEGTMSLKNPVTTPGIDPGTDRLVAQRPNHYATPASIWRNNYKFFNQHASASWTVRQVVWNVGVKQYVRWGRGFESRWGHLCPSLVVMCCVGSGLCYELITHPEKSYRLCVCVSVWSRNLHYEAVWDRVGAVSSQEEKMADNLTVIVLRNDKEFISTHPYQTARRLIFK